MKTVGTGFGARTEYILKRFVSGPKVKKALENLTVAQLDRVQGAVQGAGGPQPREDLFGDGESGYPSDLTQDERAHIGALLGGTRAEPQQPGGPKPETPEGRFEVDAIELHGLLDGDLEGAKLERVMALHRRPGKEIDRVDSWYARHYGQGARLRPGREARRAPEEPHVLPARRRVREGRRVRDRGQAPRDRQARGGAADGRPWPSGLTGDVLNKQIDDSRKALAADIDVIVERNRQEALADPANDGKSSAEAVQARLQAILSIQGSEGAGSTLGKELAKTLGPTQGGALMAMLGGNLVEAAAREMLELERTKSINSDKIIAILRGLRRQATRDLQAKVADPKLTQADREAVARDPEKAVDDLAKGYTAEFVESYDRIRGDARTWSQIVASADEENAVMLIAQVRSGGKPLEVEELEFAIRRKNVDAIKDVLRRQPTKAKVDELVAQYDFANGGEGSLKKALYGATGDASFAAYAPKAYSQGALLHGRDVAHAAESLARPAKLGGQDEAEWLAAYGQWELDVTEGTSGLMGSLREIGDDPESQVIMNESGKQLKALLAEYRTNDPWGRPRHQILAEMRRVRATLTGDAAAYEAENEALVAALKTAITFAVQIALALAIPGAGLGFIGSMALNIGATVATNMMIQGEDYSLTSLRNDILGGVLGGLGGKLGEEIVGAVASTVTKGVGQRDHPGRREGRPQHGGAGQGGDDVHGHGRRAVARRRAGQGGRQPARRRGGLDDRDGRERLHDRGPGPGRVHEHRRQVRAGRAHGRARAGRGGWTAAAGGRGTDAHPDRRRGAAAAGQRRGAGPAGRARGAGASRRGRGPAAGRARRPAAPASTRRPALAAGERTRGGRQRRRPGPDASRLGARAAGGAAPGQRRRGARQPMARDEPGGAHGAPLRHRLPRARGARRPAGGVHRRAVLARQRRGVRLPHVEGEGRPGVHPRRRARSAHGRDGQRHQPPRGRPRAAVVGHGAHAGGAGRGCRRDHGLDGRRPEVDRRARGRGRQARRHEQGRDRGRRGVVDEHLRHRQARARRRARRPQAVAQAAGGARRADQGARGRRRPAARIGRRRARPAAAGRRRLRPVLPRAARGGRRLRDRRHRRRGGARPGGRAPGRPRAGRPRRGPLVAARASRTASCRRWPPATRTRR